MRGMNQIELARASGVAQNTISEIELGKRNARPGTLKRLADTLGVEIADFFDTGWGASVDNARRLRQGGEARMSELLSAWHASKERGEVYAARRSYLDEMGVLLQQAYDAVTALFEASSGARLADQWPEIRKADRFYFDLWRLVQDAGLSIRTAAEESAAEHEATAEHVQPEARPVTVE